MIDLVDALQVWEDSRVAESDDWRPKVDEGVRASKPSTAISEPTHTDHPWTADRNATGPWAGSLVS